MITITVNGVRVEVQPGLSVAAALLRHGEPTLRTTRFAGKPRGMFCGIGACFDCIVTIDGVAHQRSCLIEVRDQMVVEIR